MLPSQETKFALEFVTPAKISQSRPELRYRYAPTLFVPGTSHDYLAAKNARAALAAGHGVRMHGIKDLDGSCKHTHKFVTTPAPTGVRQSGPTSPNCIFTYNLQAVDPGQLMVIHTISNLEDFAQARSAAPARHQNR